MGGQAPETMGHGQLAVSTVNELKSS